MPLNVERRHPQYDTWVDTVDFLWRSYLGGRHYHEGDYLDRYPRETNQVHKARKERAYYLNYVSAVVDAYISEVFKQDPVRENPPEEFEADATGSGVSFTDLMRQAMTFALATNGAHLVIDLDDSGNPYAHQLHPANLLDFSYSQDGYEWALTAEKHVEDSDPTVPRVEEDRFRLWTPNEWQLYDKDARVVDEGSNAAGLVPIVDVAPGEMALSAYDIARIAKRVYNLCSQLDEMLINVTFPQLYVPSEMDEETGEEQSAMVIGTSRVLYLPPESSQAPGFLAPPDGPAKLHVEEREKLINSIYSLAGLERRDPDQLKAQSGAAKQYDFRETNSRLSALANATEQAELSVFEVLRAYGKAGDVNVSYPKDFNVRAFREQLDEYVIIAEAPLPPTVKREAAKDLAGRIVEERTQEEKRAVTDAVEAMDDAAFGTAEDPLESLLNGGR